MFFSGIGLAIASFFLLPAILEQKYIDIASMKGVIGDIKNAVFGVGLPFIPSKLDFQVSHILFHQTLAILIIVAINLVFLGKEKNIWRSNIFWSLFLLGLFLMMSAVSLPIWESSSILQKVQAPWRLLSIFSFGGAILCAGLVFGLNKLESKLKFLGFRCVCPGLLFDML